MAQEFTGLMEMEFPQGKKVLDLKNVWHFICVVFSTPKSVMSNCEQAFSLFSKTWSFDSDVCYSENIEALRVTPAESVSLWNTTKQMFSCMLNLTVSRVCCHMQPQRYQDVGPVYIRPGVWSKKLFHHDISGDFLLSCIICCKLLRWRFSWPLHVFTTRCE